MLGEPGHAVVSAGAIQLQLGARTAGPSALPVVFRYYEQCFPLDPASLGVLLQHWAQADTQMPPFLLSRLQWLSRSLLDLPASCTPGVQDRAALADTHVQALCALLAEHAEAEERLRVFLQLVNEGATPLCDTTLLSRATAYQCAHASHLLPPLHLLCESRTLLDFLLCAQAYKLVYWRDANTSINYR